MRSGTLQNCQKELRKQSRKQVSFCAQHNIYVFYLQRIVAFDPRKKRQLISRKSLKQSTLTHAL